MFKLGVKKISGRVAVIRRIFWFVFWVSFVPILAISTVGYFSGRAILEEKALEQLSVLNDARADQFDLFIEKLKVRTADWSSDGKIRNDTEEISQSQCTNEICPDVTALPSELSAYLKDKKLPLDPTVALVDVLDLNGIVIASSNIDRVGEDKSKEHVSFPQARSASFGQVVFTPELVVEEDEFAGKPIFHLASPLVSVESGKTVGVLLMYIDNNELNALLSTTEGETLETYLVNREKFMISPSRFIPDAVLAQSVNTPPVRACLDHNEDYQGSYLDYRGEPVIGVSKCLANGLGALITEIDEAEAFVSAITFRNIVLLALAVLFIVVLGYAIWGGKRLLPQPTTTTTTITITTALIIIIVLIIGGGFSLFFSKSLEQFAFRTKTEPIFDLVQAQADRHIGNAEYFARWQDKESQARFADFVSELKNSLPPVAAIKIYNSDSTLVWTDLATVKNIIGKKHESEDVLEALAGEQKIESAEKEIQEQVGLPNLLEIYTPIFLAEDVVPVSVMEIYFDTSDLAAYTRQLYVFIWGLVFLALLIIYLLLHNAFRKQNEQITKQAKELSSIIDRAPIGIYTLNKDGVIDSFNPKMVELAGAKSAKEVIGLNALELSTYKAVGLDKFFRKGLTGKSFETEIRYVSYTGKRESFRHYFCVPLFSSDGKTVERLLLLVEEITERKRLEAEIEKYTKNLETKVEERTAKLEKTLVRVKELNELRNKFIQIVSHQLRTPLNAIRWNLETLLAEELGKLKKEQEQFIRIIYDADLEVIKRIRDLLTVMDIEEGKVILTKQDVAFESLWGSVLAEWKKLCKVKGVDCVYSPPKETFPTMNLDPEKIRTTMEKLTENAVTYTDKGGKNTAKIFQTDSLIRFEITDTGVGIPKAEQKGIFTPFFRATNASTMLPDASGLGLSIAKYFVEQHGGKIGFNSVEREGSTFWFELPIK